MITARTEIDLRQKHQREVLAALSQVCLSVSLSVSVSVSVSVSECVSMV